MPQPKKKGETDEQFISRCMSEIKSEYPDEKQRYAVCVSYSEKMSKENNQEELFVLQPRKTENRGVYLTRCSKHPKVRTQFKNLKERMGFCLNCFNEYYRYWSKLEDFAEVPADTALGECIAREKAKGFDYKEAYAHCSTKVGTPPLGAGQAIVLGEEFLDPADDTNLLVEPVMFGNDVSIDFDDTLSTKDGQEMAKRLIDEGVNLFIITRRQKDDSEEVYKIAEDIGIPKENIYFTNGKLKWETIKKLGITKHIDNNSDELDAIKENLPEVKTVKFKDIKK